MNVHETYSESLFGGADYFAKVLEHALNNGGLAAAGSPDSHPALLRWKALLEGVASGALRVEQWNLLAGEFGLLGRSLAAELRQGVGIELELGCVLPVLLGAGAQVAGVAQGAAGGAPAIVAFFHRRALFVPNMRGGVGAGVAAAPPPARARRVLASWARSVSAGVDWRTSGPLWRRLAAWALADAPACWSNDVAGLGDAAQALERLAHDGWFEPLSAVLEDGAAAAGPGSPVRTAFAGVPVALDEVAEPMVCPGCSFPLHGLDDLEVSFKPSQLRDEHTSVLRCPACGGAVLDVRTGLAGGAWDPLEERFCAYTDPFDVRVVGGGYEPRSAFRANESQGTAAVYRYGRLKIKITEAIKLSFHQLFYSHLVVFGELGALAVPDLPLRPEYAGLLDPDALEAVGPIEIHGGDYAYSVRLRGLGSGQAGCFRPSYPRNQQVKRAGSQASVRLWPSFRHDRWRSYLLEAMPRGAVKGMRYEDLRVWSYRRGADGVVEGGLVELRANVVGWIHGAPALVGMNFKAEDTAGEQGAPSGNQEVGGLWYPRYHPVGQGAAESQVCALDPGTEATIAVVGGQTNNSPVDFGAEHLDLVPSAGAVPRAMTYFPSGSTGALMRSELRFRVPLMPGSQLRSPETWLPFVDYGVGGDGAG